MDYSWHFHETLDFISDGIPIEIIVYYTIMERLWLEGALKPNQPQSCAMGRAAIHQLRQPRVPAAWL